MDTRREVLRMELERGGSAEFASELASGGKIRDDPCIFSAVYNCT